MEVEKGKQLIMDAFRSINKLDINFAYQILELILQQDVELQPMLFQYICEKWGNVKNSDESIIADIKVSASEYDAMKRLYGEMVDASLLSFIKLGLASSWEREKFYVELWKYIKSNPIWEDEKIKAFVLYYIAIDMRSPYFKIGKGIKMSEDDFSSIQDDIVESFQEYRFVNALEFDQITERASLILDIIEKLPSKVKQVVMLAKIISFYDRRYKNLLDKLG